MQCEDIVEALQMSRNIEMKFIGSGPVGDLGQVQYEIELGPTPDVKPTITAVKLGKQGKGPIGRKLEDVWGEFEVTSLGRNKKMTVCRHCRTKTSEGARAYRLRQHLRKCERYLENTGIIPKTNPNQPITKDSINHKRKRPDPTSSASSSDASLDKRKEEGGKDSHEESDVIHQQLAMVLISAKIPMKIVHNEEFKKLINVLKPDYNLPTEDHIRGHLFQLVYKKLQTATENSLHGENVILIQSGWSFMGSTHYLITHSLQKANRQFFLNAVEIPKENDAFQCATLVKDAMTLAQNRYGCKIIGLVTDNINRFLEVKNFIETFTSDLHIQASLLHVLLSIGQSFIRLEIMDKIMKIFKYFRNHDYQCNKLQEQMTNSPELRWNNNFEAITAYVNDREKYIEVLTEPKYQTSSKVYLHEPVVQIPMKGNAVEEAVFLEVLNNPSINKMVDDLNLLLHPLQDAITYLQQNKCNLADGISRWLSWTRNNCFTTDQNQQVEEHKAIALSPVGIASYMLHPKYKGLNLSEEEMEAGRQYIVAVNFQYLDPVIAFLQTDDTLYPKSMMNDDVCKAMDPIRWWKEQHRNTKLPTGFVHFTLSLLTLTATATAWDACLTSSF